MIWSIWLTLLLFLKLNNAVSVASTCIAQMMMCSQQMTSDVATVRNTTTVCGIMDSYISCIELSCNISLTPCDLNRARNRISDVITDYGVRCVMDITPGYEYFCSSAPSMTSPFVTCIALFIYCILNLRHR